MLTKNIKTKSKNIKKTNLKHKKSNNNQIINNIQS